MTGRGSSADQEVEYCSGEDSSQSKHYNPPGRSSLKYRAGTHSTFFQYMLASLPTWKVPDGRNKDNRPLSALCTRETDDPSIALMNAWATVADVLTFYQERILNEGYLRSATERRSVLELARSIGYELGPGVSAGTFLAFTAEEVPETPEFKVQGMPSMPDSVVVPKGTKVQSVPDPGQQPQTFETNFEIAARAKWNSIRPRARMPQTLSSKAKVVYLDGLEDGIKAGDLVLFVEENNGQLESVPKRVKDVILEAKLKRTSLFIEGVQVGTQEAEPEVSAEKKVFAIPKTDPKSLDEGNVTGLFRDKEPWRQNDLESLISILGWNPKSMSDHINKTRPKVLARAETPIAPSISSRFLSRRSLDDGTQTSYQAEAALGQETSSSSSEGSDGSSTRSGSLSSAEPGIYLFKVTSSPFGHNAPLWRSLPKSQRALYSNWDGANEPSILEDSNKVRYPDSDLFFERSLSEVVRDSWILLSGPFETDLSVSGNIDVTLTDDEIKVKINGSMNEEGGSTDIVIKWSINGVIKKPIDKKGSFRGTVKGTIDGGELAGEIDGIAEGVLRSKKVKRLNIRGAIKDSIGSAKGTIEADLSGKIKLVTEEDETKFEGEVKGTATQAKIGPHIRAYRVGGVTERTLTDFTLTGKATGVSLKNIDGVADAQEEELSKFKVRSATIRASSRALELTELPIESPVGKGTAEESWLTLDGVYLGLKEGQYVIITGERKDLVGAIENEVAVLSEIQTEDAFTKIFFKSGLKYTYIRDTVTINANVAPATHGETSTEVMGSGDGSLINQRFALKRSPLTYVSASNPLGVESTLEVRVDGVAWKEAPSLYELDPHSENFIIRIDEEERAHVTFGDGLKGARLPTGRENVEAVYRMGIGNEGMLAADRLTLLKTRPTGVRSVTNPLPTSGASDPEDTEHARYNAPRKILNMERIVSLKDFEDFACLFPGIGKVQAVLLSKGERKLVHITVGTALPSAASPSDHTLDLKSDLYVNMVTSIKKAAGTVQHFVVDTYRQRFFNLEAKVGIDGRYKPESVISNVKTALESTFTFDRRDFGQPATSSEVLGTIQGVEGVIAVDLDKFYVFGEEPTAKNVLSASRAEMEGDRIKRADLLLINPKGVKLEVASL